jgi:hypothetical protein
MNNRIQAPSNPVVKLSACASASHVEGNKVFATMLGGEILDLTQKAVVNNNRISHPVPTKEKTSAIVR